MTDRPARSEAIDISPVADGYVVYDPGRDLVHYLNHTAAMTLELCDGQQTAEEISSFLEDVFTGAADVRAGVASCIARLRDLGLVQPASPAPVAAVPAQARTEAARTAARTAAADVRS